MTDLRGGNSYGSSNGFCLHVHDGAIVVGLGPTELTGERLLLHCVHRTEAKHLIAPKALLLRLSDNHKS